MNLSELQSRIKALEPIGTDRFWDMKRRQLRENILGAGNIQNFLKWPEIGVTMFLGGWPWMEHEYRAVLNERPEWGGVLREDDFGDPERYYQFDSSTSANLVHMAYHLLQWEKATGRKVSELKSVVELGGGYGAMAKIIHRLGFKGKYYIYDLPEFAALQEFYLSQVMAPFSYDVQWVGQLPKTPGLLLATWSFSEMPVELRKDLMGQVKASSYLFGYQQFFEWVDNPAWFAEWIKSKPDYDWTTQPIAHVDGEHWYLFGTEKGKQSKK
jgi:hypothetical protein